MTDVSDGLSSTPVIRLHMLAIPHTITRSEYSHCAFTGKVQRFSPMMMAQGFEVYHYGVATSESGATKQIDLLTVEQWKELRVKSYMKLHPEKSEADTRAHLANPTAFVGDLGNWSTPLYEEFNRRLREELPKHYRSTRTDIVCIPFGRTHDAALNGLDLVVVESGIGYPDSYRNYRIFESYAWMHHELCREKKWGQNYWFVAPNYFNEMEWPLSLSPKIDTVGFLGRIYSGKGCTEILEVAKRMPTVRFVLCGQGDPAPFMKSLNVFYKPPIHGTERAEYLGSLVALMAPTQFIEPFCGVAVEAQLCGTPVITKDFGAQTETVEQGVTGVRCHTLEDYCEGIRLAQAGRFDRAAIRERAVRLYGYAGVGAKYNYAFRCIMDVHNGTNGWYSPTSHIGASF